MSVDPPADVFLSATDIARLAEVRRPAVSNWRRRYPDFPRPVSGTSTNPLFSWSEVEDWCERHDRTFAPTSADRLWLRSESVGGAHMTEFLAHLGAELAGIDVTGLLPPPAPEWGVLLDRDSVTGEADSPRELYDGLCDRFQETWARQEDDETSPAIADLMVSLAGVHHGQNVLDPACRTGVLPLAAERAGADDFLLQAGDAARGIIAQARLLLGGHRCELAIGDALTTDAFSDQATNGVVLCDPPLRETQWDQEALAMDPRWAYGLPPKGEPDLAWLQHCLAHVRPGGSVVMRMPAATASRRSGRRIRANLLRAGCVRAVVELPKPLDQTTHLWVLRRPEGPGDVTPSVLTVSGAADARTVGAQWARHLAGEELGDCARAIPVADLMDGDVDLTPATHFTGRVDRQAVERLPRLQEELLALLRRTEREMPGLEPPAVPEDAPSPTASARTTTLGALVTQGQVRLLRSPNDLALGEGTLPVLTAQDLRLGRAASERTHETPDSVITRQGDVIVPPRGEGVPHVVREDQRVGLGPTLTLLRVAASHLDPDFLAGFLGERGDSGRSTSGRSGVRNARIPVLSLDEQREYGSLLRGIAETELRLRQLSHLGEEWVHLARQAVRSGGIDAGRNGRDH
ncbi:N-6 DNA methylase [Spiractinospora alimapuensis]|uniref:N-6 DNA methylase n=1 Tax=Spiractinospora alimapuensis TaxID=2820884 RepID=UPI001F48D9E2|nr:N-6 DNA methylase [Spiractinospora alimapuensis]QVQ53917.1 N-6 DNA methylase [Spiractinospora alimapuensis]